MADAVTVKYLFNGVKRKIIHLTNISDGTGETGVNKVDISTLTYMRSLVPTYTVVDMIDYAIQGFTSVRLYWDHTTDDLIAVCPVGMGTLHWSAIGGNVDPRSAGGPGDILLTTAGGASGASYELTLYLRPKGGDF